MLPRFPLPTALRAAFITALASTVIAQEKPLAFTGAQIIPIAGEPIARGVLVVQGGKILAVGSADTVRVPAGIQDGARLRLYQASRRYR